MSGTTLRRDRAHRARRPGRALGSRRPLGSRALGARHRARRALAGSCRARALGGERPGGCPPGGSEDGSDRDRHGPREPRLSAAPAGLANVMRGPTAANQVAGLVMFSDTAYQLLPPFSPTSALLQFERFFGPQSIYHGQPLFAEGPWSQIQRRDEDLERPAGGPQRAPPRASRTRLAASPQSHPQLPLGGCTKLCRGRSLPPAPHVPLRIVPLGACTWTASVFRRSSVRPPLSRPRRSGRRRPSRSSRSRRRGRGH